MLFEVFLASLVLDVATAATCADLVGPSGYSDCSRRVSLCTNAVYSTLMRTQCPYTCGYCTNSTTTYNSTTTNSTSNATCYDKIGPNGYSDCSARAYLCSNSLYYTLMTQQCPVTCGRCSSNSTTNTTTTVSTSSSCVDLIGPNGYSDCPARAYLCSNAAYYSLMTQQCPKTCGRCSSNSTYTYTARTYSGCVDLIGPKGYSECFQRRRLCSNSLYYDVMTQQCPATCGRCFG